MGTIINCKYCGKERHYLRNNKEIFCSRECAFAHKARPPKTKILSECPNCGRIFSGRLKNSYCSDDCRKEKARKNDYLNAKRKKVISTYICSQCGAITETRYGVKRRNFCSYECGLKFSRKIEKAKRRARLTGCICERVDPIAVFNRDRWRCQLCKKKLKPFNRGTYKDSAPELDHIIPLSRGGDHSYQNTQCVCRKCNAKKSSKEIGQLRLF